MSEVRPTNETASLSEEIDRVADRFESAWKGGTAPDIRAQVSGWEGEPRRRLIHELILIDRQYRLRQGLPCAEEDYRRDWPEVVHADPTTAPAAENVPEQVGRYRLGEVLGSGSFGTVYRAHDERMDREVALKLLCGGRLVPGTGGAEFLHEARVAARLRHPNVVTVHDAGEADGRRFIVYELVEGQSLRERLGKGPLPPADAARLLGPVADALHHAHTQGLLHRDVKPANILVDTTGRPRLIDFGLGVREQDLGGEAGRLVGSYAYLAPEMVRGEGHRLDGRGDVYSLGVVLYEALCGRRPFRGDTREALFDQILHQEPKPPRQIDDTIPAELERICLKAMAKRITERYTTARDLALDLSRWVDGAPQVAGPPARPAWADSSASASRFAVGVVPRGLRPFGGADADFFLDLLPGPRERDGLPESVHFWKERIEPGTPEPFGVGLICGPSGCGKSSLVRAGLLPRLGPTVVTVYAEAEREGTESRLRERLLRACPERAGPDLAGLVAALRRGGLPGRKVLVVLDQLEQWLQGRGAEPADAPLVAALRQADGEHVQFLLLVRDDYWLGVSRLFRELEVPLREGENLRVVDLFDARHARRVLRAFGQAHGALPGPGNALTAEHDAFLDEAVRQLAEDGKVVPVRLSLFAELMKGRPWTPRGLRGVGGIEGLGVTFLEGAFASRSAHPEHRQYAAAARQVLGALLPEEGLIRGRGRERAELLAASGFGADGPAFARLLEVLDRDLRLITPGEPEGAAPGGYQLAHDYLVPAVRQWLRQQEQATWRGRARLRLGERAAQWARRPEGRSLPSLPEYLAALLAVPRQGRRPEERAILRAAARRYGLLAAGLALVLVVFGWAAWEAHGRLRARGLVEAIRAASINEADRLVTDELPPYQRWAGGALRPLAADGSAPRDQRLRAALACLPDQVDFLAECLLDGTPTEVQVIRERLRPFAPRVMPRLCDALGDAGRPERRFRAALALAGLDAEGAWVSAHADFLAQRLVRSNPDEQGRLRVLLQPIGSRLVGSLRNLFREASCEQAVALALTDYCRDSPELLAELAAEATPDQYSILFPALGKDAGIRERARRTFVGLARETETERPSEAGLVAAGRRRAGAVISLLRLGERAEALAALRPDADRDTATQFVHQLRGRGVEPAVAADCLDGPDGDRLRYLLVLALGEYEPGELPERVLARLEEWYRNDARPGVHSACGWLLRRCGRTAAVHAVDSCPCSPPAPGRGWLVRRVGDACLTFAVLPAGKASVGSPGTEAFHVRDEVVRDVEIERAVAVADREVTVRLWNEFRCATGKSLVAGPADRPAADLSWYEAVAFCRWLTERAGLGEEEQCYRMPPHAERTSDGLVKNWEFDPARGGFRLPTEAEWEAACRGGTRTTYSFGSDAALLGRYGWFLDGSGRRPQPVASLRPNPLGLFDVHGNVWEWCQDQYDGPGAGERAGTRVYRGGSFDNYARHGRCACRINDQPGFHFPFVGLRVVFTLPSR